MVPHGGAGGLAHGDVVVDDGDAVGFGVREGPVHLGWVHCYFGRDGFDASIDNLELFMAARNELNAYNRGAESMRLLFSEL